MATGQYIGVNGVARKVTTPYIGVEGVARKVAAGYVGVSGVARKYFCLVNKAPVVLQVEKMVYNTYANETTYEDESFILLDIYPKSANCTVKVTYGDLTKTLTFSGISTIKKQVYFGTFNGVPDSMTTPDSGTLTIEGDYVGFGCGVFNVEKYVTDTCSCITEINEFGDIEFIPDNAFESCIRLSSTIIPEGVTKIGDRAFFSAYRIDSVIIPASVISIGDFAFNHSLAAMTKYTILAITPPTLGENAFYIGRIDSIVVPVGCGDAYRTAERWSEYAKYITEAS